VQGTKGAAVESRWRGIQKFAAGSAFRAAGSRPKLFENRRFNQSHHVDGLKWRDSLLECARPSRFEFRVSGSSLR